MSENIEIITANEITKRTMESMVEEEELED